MRKFKTSSLLFNHDIMTSQALDFLHKTVKVKVDRPLGTKHPKHDWTYKVNYGFIPETMSPDGEELDAYILGVDESLKEFEGNCIAVLHRTDDDDDKLIVVANSENDMSDEEIKEQVHFQEQFFNSVILRKKD